MSSEACNNKSRPVVAPREGAEEDEDIYGDIGKPYYERALLFLSPAIQATYM